MPEDDQRATRNLFIGNLDHSVSEVELRRAFEKYGIIEEVVIKRPARGQGGAYAFLKFQNLDMAHRAKVGMSGRVIGRNPIKIGYGKANPTTRLWVGGLGPNTSLAALAREFDRFGSIRTIDHVKGDSFAYIQYESLDAAQAACAKMRGFPLGGPDRRLRVDFAKAEETRYPQQYQPSPLPVHYELLPDGYTRHRNLDADLRVRDRTPPHLLYSDRERTFLEGDWTSPSKSSDRRNSLEGYSRSVRSRSGERWGDGDRACPRPGRTGGSAGASPVIAEGPPTPLTRNGAGPRVVGSLRTEAPTAPRSVAARKTIPVKGPRSPAATPSATADTGRRSGATTTTTRLPTLPTGRRPERASAIIGPLRPSPGLWKSQNTRPKSSRIFQSMPDAAAGLEWASGVEKQLLPDIYAHPRGDQGVISSLLKDHTSGSKLTQLKIAQRLRLDQPKLDEVTRRIKQGSPNGYAVLLATQATPSGPGSEGMPAVEPGLQRRLLRNLVSYLKQKQAAGVISLPVGGSKGRDSTGMLYAFPPCDFSQQYLQSALRTLGKLEEEHMVIVIVRDSA
ncbi:hypothetical protein MG293_004643 [Ovis ammon polii]|uniref:RNA-binding protein 15B n=1 Tax=Ovis ammon polii TaxID=230172 RepID=A0AAD4YEH6_OVIAM|nr:hypothetical protein MG293_004643 [Ovis ammon polii]